MEPAYYRTAEAVELVIKQCVKPVAVGLFVRTRRIFEEGATYPTHMIQDTNLKFSRCLLLGIAIDYLAVDRTTTTSRLEATLVLDARCCLFQPDPITHSNSPSKLTLAT